MGVALENARLFDETQRLFKESEQRAAELAIINSVQEGLAAQLDFQAIIDLVGDKIREIFGTRDMSIALYDRPTNVLTMPYYLEHGERFPIEPSQMRKGFTAHVIRHRQPLLINRDMAMRTAEYGSRMIGDMSAANLPGSYSGVPILKGDEAVGVVALYGEMEDAFGDSDVRLLQTLSNAMTVALENARLFDETQRLFKAEQQRAAELAIITSVQQALAAELNMQGIYDAVGDKIREIFNHVGPGDPDLRPADQPDPLSLRLRGWTADRDRFQSAARNGLCRARPAHARDARRQREHARGGQEVRQLSRFPAPRTSNRRCSCRWWSATRRAASSASPTWSASTRSAIRTCACCRRSPTA